MEMTIVAREVPTVEHAKRAALALGDAGAGLVLLHGPVREGAADAETRIGLVVVLDDLDYERRETLQRELQDRAVEASGCAVDVYLTDRPEWRCRSTRVVTCFEAWVVNNSTCLFSRMPQNTRWNKEIGLPRSSAEEAFVLLWPLGKLLASLNEMFPVQVRVQEPALRPAALQARLLSIAREAHLAAELAMKCLAHLSEIGYVAGTHDLTEISGGIREPDRREVIEALAPIRTADGGFVAWRTVASYDDDRRHDFAMLTHEYVAAHARAAADIAVIAAQRARRVVGASADERCEEILAFGRLLRSALRDAAP